MASITTATNINRIAFVIAHPHFLDSMDGTSVALHVCRRNASAESTFTYKRRNKIACDRLQAVSALRIAVEPIICVVRKASSAVPALCRQIPTSCDRPPHIR